jgi:hypothetical protein
MEELDMFLFDVMLQDVDVNMEMTNTSIVVAQNNSGQLRKDGLYGVVGVCTPVYDSVIPVWEGSVAYLDPMGPALFMFAYRGDDDVLNSLEQKVDTTSSLNLIEKPKHGTIGFREYGQTFFYKANTGYEGKDRAVFLAEFGGYRIKVIYYFKVINEKVDLINKRETDEKHCPQYHWGIWPQSSDPANWYQNPSLQTLLMGAKAALTGFADLPGVALAQTSAGRGNPNGLAACLAVPGN